MTGPAIADISHIPVSQGLSTTLARASEGARASGAPEVSLEHVLAALCDDADAADVLAACAIDTGRLKGDVIRFIIQQTGGAGRPTMGPVTVSPALVRILEAAAAAARGGRRRDINGAIVLAAIVGDARSIAAQILQDHGLTFDEAIKALQAAQAQPPRAPAPELPPPAEDVLARARERVQSRAAPSLRDMMARPQLAERPTPAPTVQDIVPSQAAKQPWPLAPADPAETGGSKAAGPSEPAPPEQPVTAEPPPAPEPQAPSPEPVAAEPVSEMEAESVLPGMGTEAAEPARDSEPAPPPSPPEAPAEVEAVPQPPEHNFPSPQLPPSAPSGQPMMPFPPAGTSSEPRWTPAGDLQQHPAGAAPPPPPVEYPGGPGHGGPGLASAQVPSSAAAHPAAPTPRAPFPAPTAHPAAGMPPLPPAPPPSGFGPPTAGPAQPLPGFPPPQPAAGPLPPLSPFPPSNPPQTGFPRSGPPPIPATRPAPAAAAAQANPYGVPPSVSAPRMSPPPPPAPVARSAAVPPPRRDAAAQAELGQLAENIPRTMRAGVTERVEIRLARAHVHDLTGGMDGGGLAWRHDVTVTKAMSVRLRAPEGGFFIETASPETQWIDNQIIDAAEDYASWRFLITPQQRGWSELQIVVSARTVGADGLAAETAFPDQTVDIKVRTNYGRAALKGLGWAVAAVAGGAVAKFGEGAFDAGSTLVAKLLG